MNPEENDNAHDAADPMDMVADLANRTEWLSFTQHIEREVQKREAEWQARTAMKEREWNTCFQAQKRGFEQELARRQQHFEQQLLKASQSTGGTDPKLVIRQVNQDLRMLDCDKGVLSQSQVQTFIQSVQSEMALGNPVNIKSFLSTTAKHAIILRFYKCLEADVVDKWEDWSDQELLRQLIQCWPTRIYNMCI